MGALGLGPGRRREDGAHPAPPAVLFARKDLAQERPPWGPTLCTLGLPQRAHTTSLCHPFPSTINHLLKPMAVHFFQGVLTGGGWGTPCSAGLGRPLALGGAWAPR